MICQMILLPLISVGCLLHVQPIVPSPSFALPTPTRLQRRQQSTTGQQSKHQLALRSPWPLQATSQPHNTTPNSIADTSTGSNSSSTTPIAKPRSGFAQTLLDVALASPIWTYILVPQARATIVTTAEKNGIPWLLAKTWLMTQMEAEWNSDALQKKMVNDGELLYPEYYVKSFHAYPEGNLCYDAALEQELAR